MIRVLNLGGGVQSICVARMSLDGELPPLDHILSADTGAEWPETYEAVGQIEAACHNRGIGFHRVVCELPSRRPDLLETLMKAETSARWSAPPLFVTNAKRSGAITHGFTKRQCTGYYKKDPLVRKMRELAGIKPRSPGPKHQVLESWLGISADEKERMKVGSRWQKVWHPLIEGPRQMVRWDCEQWLRERGYPVPVKSACFFCPYQSDRRWRACRDLHPELWQKAVALDHHLRANADHVGLNGTPYLHAKRVPLDEVDLRTPEERGQGALAFDQDGFRDECHGVCGV